MKAWVCFYCHAKIPQEKEPERCVLCGRINRDNFTEVDLPEKTAMEKEYDKQYEEALGQLEKYSEGCEPESSKYIPEE